MAYTTLPAKLSPNCHKMSQLLSRIGDKWSVMVIMTLRRQPCRFNELKREIEGISQRMLTLNLRSLERDGLIKRAVTASIPPRVDYELTDLGRSLSESVQALGSWTITHAAEIDAAQVRWDAGNSPERKLQPSLS